jgi:transcription initiation factor IIE alpha subunit
MKSLKMLFFAAFTIISFTAFSQEKAGRKDTTQHIKLYTCPMHDTVAMKQPGNCPICGMKLQLSTKEQMKKDVTKNYKCPVHLDVTSHDPGKCPKCGRKMNLSPKEQMKAEVVKLYTCPMHPEVALDKEGKCPKCGKPLVEKKQENK